MSFGSGVEINTSRCILIQSEPLEDKALTLQTVQVKRPGTQTYVLSGWAKADAVPDNVQLRNNAAYDHTKQFGLRATITYADGTHDWFYVPFNADVTAWQYVSLSITPESWRTVSTIDITCCYERNTGTAYFDNLSLTCTVAETTEYDENGKPISSAVTGINGQKTTYDDNGNVKKVVTKTGTDTSITQTFTYDSTFVHRLVSSSDGTTTQSLTHDAFGNVTSTTLKSATSSTGKEISSTSSYSSDGNRVTSTTSGNGQTTTYT